MRYKRGFQMPLSLRIPQKKNEMIKKAATKSRKTKTAYILEAVDEKLGITKTRGQMIRELAGWMSHAEAEELREVVDIFNKVNQGDWD
jgi:hypothetical protein